MEYNENNLIITKDLKKTYKDNGVYVNAINGIDITINSGEFTAIVGPSGSGKTTFFNLISGLDSLTYGKVWLNSKLMSDMSGKELSDFRRDNIGFVFQAYNLIPVLTVEENIECSILMPDATTCKGLIEKSAKVLKKGDIILGLANLPVEDPQALIDAMKHLAPGQVVTLRFWRDRGERKLQLTICAQ